jgi:hypothetical protein
MQNGKKTVRQKVTSLNGEGNDRARVVARPVFPHQPHQRFRTYRESVHFLES